MLGGRRIHVISGFGGIQDKFDLIIPPTRIASLFAGSVEPGTISVLYTDSTNSECSFALKFS
jgi:hypothetical protein